MVAALRLLLVSSLALGSAVTYPAQRTLPACIGGNKGKFGGLLLIAAPKGAKTKKGFDVDYGYFSIKAPAGGEGYIHGIYGPTATSGRPPGDLLRDSTDVVHSTWTSSLVQGVDVTGISSSGKRWRYIGTLGNAVEYSDADEATARLFDKVFDAMCINSQR